MADLINVPGLAAQPPQIWRMLWDICQRNGWACDGLAAAIQHESGWNPAARNPTPGSTATGLIQFIESTARGLGTSTAALARMSTAEQLPYVERYFLNWSRTNRIGPWDWLVFGLGMTRARGGYLSDDFELYPTGSAGAVANPMFQDADGAIRVGTVRRYLERYAGKFSDRPRLVVPAEYVIEKPKRGSDAIAGAVLVMIPLLHLFIWTRRARVARGRV